MLPLGNLQSLDPMLNMLRPSLRVKNEARITAGWRGAFLNACLPRRAAKSATNEPVPRPRCSVVSYQTFVRVSVKVRCKSMKALSKARTDPLPRDPIWNGGCLLNRSLIVI